MKIVDERKNKDVEEWHVGDVIEFGNKEDSLSLGMIIENVDYYWIVDLKSKNTHSAEISGGYSSLKGLFNKTSDYYKIARKVNVELHIKEGE